VSSPLFEQGDHLFCKDLGSETLVSSGGIVDQVLIPPDRHTTGIQQYRYEPG
jgi:hypothetical protein